MREPYGLGSSRTGSKLQPKHEQEQQQEQQQQQQQQKGEHER
jgi:hypothetical protein